MPYMYLDLIFFSMLQASLSAGFKVGAESAHFGPIYRQDEKSKSIDR